MEYLVCVAEHLNSSPSLPQELSNLEEKVGENNLSSQEVMTGGGS